MKVKRQTARYKEDKNFNIAGDKMPETG